MNRRILVPIAFLALYCTTVRAEPQPAGAKSPGPKVVIVQAADAPALEKLAVEELTGHLRRIYQAESTTLTVAPDKSPPTILVGSPATNPSIKALGDNWPMLSDQGHLVRTVEGNAGKLLVIGGGSPVATYWAVAEYAHKLGVRSLIFGDLDPVKPPPFTIEGFDILLEPRVRQRGITLLGRSPVSTMAWSLDDHKKLLRQLAKMKFNFVQFDIDSYQPFLDFRIGKTQKKTAEIWWADGELPVDGDIAGRAVFKGARFFENPDFAGTQAYADRHAAGQRFLRGLISSAHILGMTAQAGLDIDTLPPEFLGEVPDAVKFSGAIDSTGLPVYCPLIPRSPKHEEIARQPIRSLVTSYPEIDLVLLEPWYDQGREDLAKTSWSRLHREAGLKEETSLAEFARKLSVRTSDLPELASIDMVAPLIKDEALWKSATGRRIPVGLRLTTPQWIGEARRLLSLNDLELEMLSYSNVPADLSGTAPAILTIPMTKGEILPLMEYAGIPEAVSRLEKVHWRGFRLAGTLSSDSDLLLYLASRCSFDASMTHLRLFDDLISPMIGEGVADRVAKAMAFVEDVRRKHPAFVGDDFDAWAGHCWMDLADLKLTAPLPQPLVDARESFLNAMNEMYRANTRARDGNEQFTLYFARRFEFAYEYINVLEGVRKAALAREKKAKAEEIEYTQAAVESLHTALSALAAVARLPSERGLIAALNTRLYRPLKAELEMLEAEGQ